MVPGFTLCQKLVPTESPQELLLSTHSVPPVTGKVKVWLEVALLFRVENAADCPPAKTRLPPLVTSNLVVPLAEASMISPLLDWLTMNAPLLPIPPLTDNGAMVLLLLPTNTPSWYVEVRIRLAAPAAERVRLLVPVVETVGLAPASETVVPLTVRLPPKVVSPVPVVTAPLPTVFRFKVLVPAERVRAWLPLVAMVAAEPLPIVSLVPLTVRLPPKVVSPVPVVTAPLPTVFRFKVLLPADRVRLLVPVVETVGLAPASETVVPLTVRLPPKVVSPVPVVTAPLPTVFRFKVLVPAERVRAWLPLVAMVAAEPLPIVSLVPLTVRLPPKVVSPVPVVTGAFPVVLRPNKVLLFTRILPVPALPTLNVCPLVVPSTPAPVR